jgi:hypothetical protein
MSLDILPRQMTRASSKSVLKQNKPARIKTSGGLVPATKLRHSLWAPYGALFDS